MFTKLSKLTTQYVSRAAEFVKANWKVLTLLLIAILIYKEGALKILSAALAYFVIYYIINKKITIAEVDRYVALLITSFVFMMAYVAWAGFWHWLGPLAFAQYERTETGYITYYTIPTVFMPVDSTLFYTFIFSAIMIPVSAILTIMKNLEQDKKLAALEPVAVTAMEPAAEPVAEPVVVKKEKERERKKFCF